MSGEPNTTPSPFHEGEVTLQRTVGVAERLEQFGRRVIRDHMPDQHRTFYRQLPFIVLGAVDGAGDAWATLVAGYPGFMTSPDPRRLQFTTEADPADPATAGLGDGAAVGLLGIELHTRRRNRMNGHVRREADGRFAVEVEHAFGNCPQYIRLRDYEFVRAPGTPTAPDLTRPADLSDPRVREMIEGADTFFVASYVEDAAGRHVDASHRGGKPGFVRINADGSLTIPDFAGNLHFNTLGNFLLNPRAGLVFPDFRTGDLLQLTGDAEVVLDSPEIGAFQGAERLWVFRPRKVVLRQAALPLRFVAQADGDSPNNQMTGDWAGVAARLEAEALKSQWRPFRVARIVDESRVIRSIHLEPADGKGIVAHAAGQHLPIRIRPGGQDAPVIRTYTISTAPSDGHYRISVKRQGLVSTHLHDTLKVGDIIEARAPAGHFTIDALEPRPAVLLAAGVGITPILAMLRTLLFEGLRKRRVRPTYVFVAARSRAERAFDAEIAELQARAGGAVKVVRILADTTDAGAEDYDVQGRLDIATLRGVLPLDGYDFYLCGPPTFMQGLYDQLRDIGTPDARIHAEAFGPASLKRSAEGPAIDRGPPPATQPVPVAFIASGKEARWSPDSGSLLELAEARGLTPEFSCRGGNCGTCAVRVLSGAVAYPETPEAPVPEGSALICCAVPADPSATGGDRLLLDL
ncbi:MAG: 2Fe-2S iron-sulfur cluster binding domain-containing protein [Phenylobacterium sp.]|uniref:2Fe-2S iron-sulfur cluster-binding protein n=1 Tax=Phenylobacterium sp. TaxID=1871053 RepID=UPI00121B6D18|nr:pyridoxamine 5'-phosphate oxidase family protein [Phenylobacterium sp.]TAL33112.1 MAG: 2Fe-2S iron-sulfur cluster binding domain-containing protein [Phenylobacterium sp.]